MTLEQTILSWFWPLTAAHFVVFGALIVAGIYAFRVVSYYRDPTPLRVADYKMEMPHIRQSFKLTLFRLDFAIDTKFIESMKVMGGERLAQVFENNKDKMYFYMGKHVSAEATTKDSGLSLIMTNAPLDHNDYFIELEEHMNWIKGYQTRVRKVLDSEPEGFFIRNTGREMYGEEVSFIYYVPKPISRNPTIKPELLTTVEVAMSAVANADQYMSTLQKSNMNRIERDAAMSAKEHAESELKKAKEEVNFIRRQWAKKDYWAANLSTLGSPLSMAVVIGIVGFCAIILPDFLSRQLPGYTMQHYIGFAVGIGAGLTWLVSMLRK